MKKRNIIVLSFFLLLVISSFQVHKFYVSVTQVDYVKSKSRVEITSRIFIDDFNKILEKKYNKKVYLASNRQIEDANKLVENYLKEKMKVKINQKTYDLKFLGTEIDNDVLICYLKVSFSEKITTFEIENSVLTEIFKEQQNLLHTNINDEKSSFLLTDSEPTAFLEF
ncbi:conserved hypothetical protein [Flavobacterium sp. 9AF]|uniref:DUF6702 family protein n=1 Tax=Flavobacterium sp. 9AF TaxID=2653142 RepID=UPI0012F29047|nr:DUF6702 family protein [Flavobacterium sp. 9AF]VXB11142.1 conserved hypothetical protein [Flavobacterium sp. 9AF]